MNSNANKGNIKTTRVLVSNISPNTNEASIKEFFAFCGEIAALHLYKVDSGTYQEAVIKFNMESAATTACLLNNALLDGVHIVVSLHPFPEEMEKRSDSPTSQRSGTPKSTGSQSSVLTNLSNFASNVVKSVKDFDQQHRVSETITTGVSTAWIATKETAKSFDEKYKVQEKAKSAYESAREKTAELTTKVTGSPRGTSPKVQ